MMRLLMLVEGQSEEIFVKRTLAPHLAQNGLFTQPIVLWTKRLPSGGGFRGGVSNWNQILRSLAPLIRDGDAWVSTLLDYYGLPADFPGLQDAMAAASAQDRVAVLENRLAQELNHRRFIPFLALHEFEAWLFTAPDIVEAHFGKLGLAGRLRSIAVAAGAPELINDGVNTHPKARLHALVGEYKEISDGPTLLEKIGIARVRAGCPHFDAWLTQLENLGGGVP